VAARAPETVFAVRGPISRDDLPGLCERVCRVLGEAAAGEVICEVGTVGPDAVTVDALARLQLAARRRGCLVRLRHASAALVELVRFMGLTDVLPEEPMTSRPERRLSVE